MASARIPLTQARLKELLDYDPETGVFTWRFWRGRTGFVGAAAGYVAGHGYLMIGVDRQKYLAHRLAWLWMTGEWPAALIDHCNQIKIDNRWANLRQATHRQNFANTGPRKRREPLPKGVKRISKASFCATFQVGDRQLYLGSFATAEAAAARYAEKAREIHGEFVPV